MVGAGLTAAPQDILKALGVSGQVLVVSAPNIWKLHGKNWRSVAGKRGPVLIADGEKAKTLATVSRLYDAFSDNGLDRAATIVPVQF